MGNALVLEEGNRLLLNATTDYTRGQIHLTRSRTIIEATFQVCTESVWSETSMA